MTTDTAGIGIPDSAPAREATGLLRDTTGPLPYGPSHRVHLLGALGRAE
jgi:hypothetical protein